MTSTKQSCAKKPGKPQQSDDTKPPPTQDPTFQNIFGPLGVDTPGARVDHVAPTEKRHVTPSGSVRGRVTNDDVANTTASMDAAGLVAVTSTNSTLTPPLRAAEIQRAIHAVVHFAGAVLAHELGHAHGLVSGGGSQITIDGAQATTPFDGDDGDHPKNAPASELMQDGFNITFAQLVGETAPPSLGPQLLGYNSSGAAASAEEASADASQIYVKRWDGAEWVQDAAGVTLESAHQAS